MVGRVRRIAAALFRRTPRPVVVLVPPPQGAIGRHLDATSVPVEIDCTDDELQAMLDRIAANWAQYGETEPHWSVLTNPVFLRDTLQPHLPGFFEHGRLDVEQALNFVRRAGLPADRFGDVLDFGCGVGRLTVALAAYADRTVGADVSPGHLREARQAAASRGLSGVSFEQLRAVADIDRLGQFDLIVSRLVLQHNPPPVMAALYRRLLRRLGPGGVAIVQMPTFIAGRSFDVAGYLAGEGPQMEMNALPQSAIFRIIADEGCLTLEVREDIDLGALDGLSHVFAVMRPVA